jgi:hypothetical protein
VPLLGPRLGEAWDRVVEVNGNLRALPEPYTANLEQLMIGAASSGRQHGAGASFANRCDDVLD